MLKASIFTKVWKPNKAKYEIDMNVLEELNKKGFIDEPIDPTLDLFEEINKLKKEKNAVVLAHY